MNEDGNAISLDLLLSFQIAQLNSKLNAQARAIIANHGTLSLPQWRIIRLVAQKFVNTTTSVRKAAGIDKSQFSKTLNVLVLEGYVTVSPFDGDKRQLVIALTQKGVAAHGRLAPELVERQTHLLSALTPTERRTIFSAIQALAKAAERTDFSTEQQNAVA